MMKYYVAVLTGCNKDHPKFLATSNSLEKMEAHLNKVFDNHLLPLVHEDGGPLFCFDSDADFISTYSIPKEYALEKGLYDKHMMYNSEYCRGDALVVTILEVESDGDVFDLSDIEVNVC